MQRRAERPVTRKPGARSRGAPGRAGLSRRFASRRVTRESASVMSFVLEPTEKTPLPAALPGQFVVVRMRPRRKARRCCEVTRCRARQGRQQYRISVKLEPHGAAAATCTVGFASATCST